MPSELLECSWGRIRLFASHIRTDSGRTQVVHNLSSGDIHPVQDRGLRERRVHLRVQFDDFPGAPSPRDAALALESAKNTGQAAIFQHPILGRYMASVGDFSSEADESSVISADVEFIQEDEDIAITPTGAASSGASGESLVNSAAAAVDGELEKVGQLKISGPSASSILSRVRGGTSLAGSLSASLSVDLSVDLSVQFSANLAASITADANANAAAQASANASANAAVSASATGLASATATATAVATGTASAFADASIALAAAASAEASVGLFAATTIDARVAVASWQTGDVPTRQIMIDAARISNNIATMIEVGGFERDLALWPAFRSAIMLGESVRSAALSATSETPSVFVMRVLEPTALLPLAARVYGGADALDRARQITELNDISTPGWIPAGDYLMSTRPAPPSF